MRETLSGVHTFELVRCMHMYATIVAHAYVCHNSSTCLVYIMWVELGHSHFKKHNLCGQSYVCVSHYSMLFVTREMGVIFKGRFIVTSSLTTVLH